MYLLEVCFQKDVVVVQCAQGNECSSITIWVEWSLLCSLVLSPCLLGPLQNYQYVVSVRRHQHLGRTYCLLYCAKNTTFKALQIEPPPHASWRLSWRRWARWWGPGPAPGTWPAPPAATPPPSTEGGQHCTVLYCMYCTVLSVLTLILMPLTGNTLTGGLSCGMNR